VSGGTLDEKPSIRISSCVIPLQPVATTRLAIAPNAPIGAGDRTIDRILHTRPLKMLDSVQNRLTHRELEPITGAEEIPDHQTYAQGIREIRHVRAPIRRSAPR
jgi:hypothetical protein